MRENGGNSSLLDFGFFNEPLAAFADRTMREALRRRRAEAIERHVTVLAAFSVDLASTGRLEEVNVPLSEMPSMIREKKGMVDGNVVKKEQEKKENKKKK